MHLLVMSVKKKIKYEGTSSNKITAANRKEERYKHTQQTTRQKRNKLIAAEEKGKWGARREMGPNAINRHPCLIHRDI